MAIKERGGTNPLVDVNAAGTAHTEVVTAGGLSDVFPVTLSLDTSAYVSGDVLADTQVLTDAMLVAGGRAILQSVVVIDEDDQKQGFILLFFSSSQSLGTENAAPDVSDSEIREFLGKVTVNAGDYLDLGGASVAQPSFTPFLLEAAADSKDLYVAALSQGTGTYSASGLKLRLGLLQDYR